MAFGGMVKDWMNIAAVLAATARLVWMFSALILAFFKQFVPDRVLVFCRAAYHEIKPFYLFFLGLEVVHSALQDTGFSATWGNGFNLLGGLVCWWVYKDINDDDDRWKRRRKKLAEKVQAVGSKLTVVPREGPA